MTYTRYAVINFLISLSVLLTAYRTTKALTGKISDFNFMLSMINQMYRATQKKDTKYQQGRVKLSSMQYLKLLCAVTMPMHCCSSKKKATKRTRKHSRVSAAINEGGEEIN